MLLVELLAYSETPVELSVKVASSTKTKIFRSILFTIYGMCLFGCSSNIRVTYYSDPTGAKVYDEGRFLGATPLTLYYEPTPEFNNVDCMFLKPLLARWLSGAENTPTSIKACSSEGKELVFTFFRPQNIPGADIDAQYASQYDRSFRVSFEKSGYMLAITIG